MMLNQEIHLVLHDEPIFLENKIVGESTSGNYSFFYDKSMVFGYVSSKVDIDKNYDKFEIEIAKKRYKLNLIKEPLHDLSKSICKNLIFMFDNLYFFINFFL